MRSKSKNRTFIKLILTLIFLFFIQHPPLEASGMKSLNEDFNSLPLDENTWQVYTNTGEFSIENGWITLSSSTKTYPYIHLKEDLSSEDKSCLLEIRFQYRHLTPWGVGISIGNSLIPNGTPINMYDPLNENGNSIRVWTESTNNFRVQYRNCNDKPCIKQEIFSSLPNTNIHFLEMQFSSQNAEVFLDGTPLGSFELAQNFNIWFGNPIVVENDLPWTQLSIDYIKYACKTIHPLIIIPGLGASWNTRAMVYGEEVADSEWRMTPFVNIYNRLIETAKNNGYQFDKDLFVWNYDWRKPLPEIAANLDEFIENTPELSEAEKIDIVGHSLGGLVARTWAQSAEDHTNTLNKLIAVGSPHQGAVQAYEALAGGKVGDRVDLGWLAMQLLLQIHRQRFETNAEVVRRLAPVLQDITPTFNFLKKYRRVLPVNQAAFFNNHLTSLNQNFNLSQISHFIVGSTGSNTPEWLWLKNQSLLDQILDLWPDGHPYKIINGAGDGTVLVKSARWKKVNYDEFNLDHHRIISDPTSVAKIVELLGKSDAEIAEVDPVYPDDNLLIFYLASPATLKVDGREPEESDLQFIIIPHPENKTYQAEINGTDTGTYHLYLGQITPLGNYWQTYEGEIAPGEKKTYQFAIDFNNPQRDPLVDENGLSHFQEAKALLEKLYQETNDRYLASSLAYLNQAIGLIQQKSWSETINKVKKSLYYSARFRRKLTDSQIQEANQVQEAMKLLATGWQNILTSQSLSSRTRAYREYRRARSYYSLANRLLRLFKRRKRPIAKTKAIAINESKELLDEIKIEWKKKNYSFVEPQSYVARLFAWSGFPR